MADFEPCFYKVKDELEGGDKLINVPGDRGGMTYAGISRNKNPHWVGWVKIDRGEFDDELATTVEDFYRKEYWDKIKGTLIKSQSAAYNLYALGIVSGIGTAIKLCQRVLNVTPDGIFGPATLEALNDFIQDKKDEEIFVLRFGLTEVLHYRAVVMNDPRRKDDLLVSNQKFICGWIGRVQKVLAYWGVKYP